MATPGNIVTAVMWLPCAMNTPHPAPCRSNKRTGANYVDALMLRCAEEPSHWVLRGAAVLFNPEA